MAALNLRVCEINYEGTHYNILVAVSDLDNLDIAIQEAASGIIGAHVDLPVALVKDQNLSVLLPSYDFNDYVYTGE